MVADARVVWLLSCCLWVACANREQQPQLRIVVEADGAVREVVDEVTTRVEGQAPDEAGWKEYAAREFSPPTSHDWPLEYRLDVDGDGSYQLTATARDDRGAVVGQARAVRKLAGDQELELRVLFDASCLRRAQPCASGETCHDGACVDARDAFAERAARD